MIKLGIDQSQLARLEKALGAKAKRLPREVRTAINATARKVAAETAKDLSKIMPLKQATLKKIIKLKKQAEPTKLSATVGIGQGYPTPLRMHKPTQLKGRVSVKMRKKQGRHIVADAFIAKQYGNHVFQRQADKSIRKKHGPRPGSYYAELGTEAKAKETAKKELPKQIERRIRFLTLKAAGSI